MKNFFSNIFSTNTEVRNEILSRNLVRIVLLTVLGIPLGIIQIAYFYNKLTESNALIAKWQTLILASHSLLVFLAVPVLFLAIYLGNKKFHKANLMLSEFVYAFVIFFGVSVTCFDQLVTTSITPVISAFIIMALVIRIPPLHCVVYLVIAFLLFYFGIEYFASDKLIMLSNRVNVVTLVCTSLIISIVFWRNAQIRIEQTNVINLQKKQLEERLSIIEQKSAALDKLNKAKDTFVAVVAHDLRNPIANILSLLNLISVTEHEDNQNKADKLYRLIEQLGRTTRNTQKLLDNLLQWAQIQRAEITFNPIKIKLEDLAHNVINELNTSIKEKNIQINIPENAKFTFIDADTHMLQTVMRNLISNAIKFSFSGGCIDIQVIDNNAHVQISVKDSGVGMNSETAANLFDLSKKNSAPGTHGEMGTGLGLILCKEFIDKHKGNIWVESEEEKGTSIHFSLPKIAKNIKVSDAN